MSLRTLPSVHHVIELLAKRWPASSHVQLRDVARLTLEQWRESIKQGHAIPSIDVVLVSAEQLLQTQGIPSLRPVINATGVIIQTNLGRAPLSHAACQAVVEAAQGYSNLEYDLDSGERGSRSVHLSGQLVRLTGAEAALVVNNAASALILCLAALASRRDVLVSRSQSVEIGGGFRVPDIIHQSGCRLVDVGTTNRTYASDYEAALTSETGAILRIHRSNFALIGFVHEPHLAELAAIAQSAELPLIDDIGSGALLDTRNWGLASEPQIQDSLTAGADLVICSGDKLLGGPQAGIIVGRSIWINRLAKHPLARALRVDKMTIAALGATLSAYERNTALSEIPVWHMISTSLDDLRQRSERIHGAISGWEIAPSECAIGGGSLPGAMLPSWALTKAVSQPNVLAERLRDAEIPVIARVQGGRIWLDLRTVLPEQDEALIRVVRTLVHH